MGRRVTPTNVCKPLLVIPWHIVIVGHDGGKKRRGFESNLHLVTPLPSPMNQNTPCSTNDMRCWLAWGISLNRTETREQIIMELYIVNRKGFFYSATSVHRIHYALYVNRILITLFSPSFFHIFVSHITCGCGIFKINLFENTQVVSFHEIERRIRRWILFLDVECVKKLS